MNERFSVGGLKYAHRGGSAQLIIENAKALGVTGDPVWRQRLAELWAKEKMFTFLHQKVGAAVMAGREPGPEGSILKLAMGEFITLAAQTGADLAGAGGIAWDPDTPAADAWAERLCGSPCFTIAGGTTEVLKNLTAERGARPAPRHGRRPRRAVRRMDRGDSARRQAMTFTPQLTINGRQVERHVGPDVRQHRPLSRDGDRGHA